MAATAGAAVKWLGNLAVEEAVFLYKVKGKVEELQDELKWMTCFLQDVDANRDRDARLREWIKQIIWMAYEAEDLIESFIVKVEGNRRSGLMNKLKRYSCFIRELIVIHNVGRDIDDLKLKISTLTSRLQTYGIKIIRQSDSSSVRREVAVRKSYAHHVLEESDIVGLKNETNLVVKQLVREVAGASRIVALCGMGGLGKTTLAKKVYHHSDVRQHFEAFAWACISQQCRVRGVLSELLRGLSSEKVDDNRSKEYLSETLFRIQQEKKCLIVLDDIWKEDHWISLKDAFPSDRENSRGGKLVLTTRIESVPRYIDDKASIHKQSPLEEKDALLLLEKKLGGDPAKTFGEEYGGEMMKLAKEMLKHCGGLPLAIVALGGVLATKTSLDEWQSTNANIKSYLYMAKDGGLTSNEVLELSYYDLPMYLKPCFLYFGLFPEDAVISARKLIHLWMAEGFISTSLEDDDDDDVQQGSLEEVGESYLMELVDRSMVQVVSTRTDGKIKTCRIHDVVRGVCLSKAAKEKFFKVVVDGSHSTSSSTEPSSSTPSSGKTRRGYRRLAVQDKQDVHWPKTITDFVSNNNKMKAARVKSLLICGYWYDVIMKNQISLMKEVVKKFTMLRVLDLENIVAGALPKGVGNLVHLRYLSVRNSVVRAIPYAIKNLRCLQTLDLRVRETELPDVIWKMRQLRHLYMPDKYTVVVGRPYTTLLESMVQGTGRKCASKLPGNGLNNLRTLSNFKQNEFHRLEDVLQLAGLVKLSFQINAFLGKEDLGLIKNSQSLSRGRLQHLDFGLRWEALTELAAAIEKFPHLKAMKLLIKGDRPRGYSLKPHMLPDKITSLTLLVTKIGNTDAIQILERLPNLRKLKLETLSYSGKEISCSHGGFPKLISLSLKHLRNLENISIEEGAMPTLRKLQIRECMKLKMIPDGISSISSLQVLKIYYMPRSFMERVSKRRGTAVGDGESDGSERREAGGADFDKVKHIPVIRVSKKR